LKTEFSPNCNHWPNSHSHSKVVYSGNFAITNISQIHWCLPYPQFSQHCLRWPITRQNCNFRSTRPLRLLMPFHGEF
jgi:hypothetical protein